MADQDEQIERLLGRYQVVEVLRYRILKDGQQLPGPDLLSRAEAQERIVRLAAGELERTSAEEAGPA